MKKKIKDLTIQEFVEYMKKHDRTPFQTAFKKGITVSLYMRMYGDKEIDL